MDYNQGLKMAFRRCKACCGSGKVMGGGMVFNDCENCSGRGKIEEELKIEPVIVKDSDVYRIAKKKIKDLDLKMTDAKAEELLDDELERLTKPDNIKVN